MRTLSQHISVLTDLYRRSIESQKQQAESTRILSVATNSLTDAVRELSVLLKDARSNSDITPGGRSKKGT